MPPKKRPAPAEAAVARPSPSARAALQRELVQCSTQTGLVQALTALQTAGVLTDAIQFKPSQFKKELTAAKKMHSDHVTAYGRVVQQMDIPSTRLSVWDFVHPMALLVYLASVSDPFFNIMATTAGCRLA